MAPLPWYLCRIASHIAIKMLNAIPSCTRLAIRGLRTSGCVGFLNRGGHRRTQNFQLKWHQKKDLRCIKFLPGAKKSQFWLKNTVLLMYMIFSKDLSSYQTKNCLIHKIYAKLKLWQEKACRFHSAQLPQFHPTISAMPVSQLKKYSKFRLKIRISRNKMKIWVFISKIS